MVIVLITSRVTLAVSCPVPPQLADTMAKCLAGRDRTQPDGDEHGMGQRSEEEMGRLRRINIWITSAAAPKGLEAAYSCLHTEEGKEKQEARRQMERENGKTKRKFKERGRYE